MCYQLTALIALPARHAGIAAFGVRQTRWRSSHAHDPARGTPLTLLATGMRWVLVTITAFVRNE